MTVNLLGRIRASSLAQNAMALYATHLAGLVLPLIAIPYLARVLRPENWGLVVFSQSFAAWLALLLEYGFYLSATRRLAQVREDPRQVARVVSDVQAAKGLLLVVISVLALLAYLVVPAFRQNPTFLGWAWLIAVVQGFSPFWYFQGVERMRAPAIAEAASKAATTVGIFLFIRGPQDAGLALALQGLAGLGWVALANYWIYREVPWVRFRLAGAVGMLREAAGLFVFRTASGMYLQANSFILGMLASAQTVAYFGGADRIIRGAINLIHPATQAVFPRVSHLVQSDRNAAGRLLTLSLLMVGGLGLAIGIGAAYAAPFLVRVFLGPGYEATVPVLRTLAFLPPIIALGTVLGIQWALPRGFDRPFYSLVVAAGVVNVGLAVLLVPRLGAQGMALSTIVAECVVVTGLLLLAWRNGRSEWGAGIRSVLSRRAALPPTREALSSGLDG